MKYIISFLLWIFVSLWIFFSYNQTNNQTISNVDFSSTVSDKINLLRESIKNIWSTTNSLNNNSKLEKINNIKEVLDKKYINTSYISWDKMWDKAIQAYVSAIWDPFTVYLTSEDNTSLHEELKWSSDFEGIWAVVTKVPEGIMVERIIKDGPAFKAGLKPLDVILKANGTNLSNLPLWEGVNEIKWPKWTKVNLTINRDWKIMEIEVTRDKVEIKSVESNILEYDNAKLWYISISSIWEETYTQFVKQSNELLSDGAKWIILDLRWNGGWYLEVGYKIWSMWSQKDDVVVKTKYKDDFYNRVLKATDDGKLHNFPTVILIDAYTASAWEIITAAIQVNNKNNTKLVWTETFWKWTIQTLEEFRDGSSLKYTIWKWFTPDDKNVSDGIKPWNGIKPDKEVEFDSDSYTKDHIDNQLDTAKQTLINLINK